MTLVVPYFNPGRTVRETVERADRALAESGRSYEIIAVSDGSTDKSPESLEGLLPGSLRTVVLEANRGKGFALRTGFALGRGAYLGFIDADGDIAPELLSRFVETAFAAHADICFGSKRHEASEVDYPFVRRVYSRGYQLLVRVLFRLSVPDTQTGIKLFRREVLDVVLPRAVEARFALDLELFVLAQQSGFDQFVALPVRVEKQASSTVSLGSVRSILWDTIAIFWRLRVLRAGVRTRGQDRGEHRQGERPDAGWGVPDQDVDAG